jgi:hypothetical protein
MVGWTAATAWRTNAALAAAFGPEPLRARWAEGSYLFGLMTRPVTMAGYLESMTEPGAGLLFNASTVGFGDVWDVPDILAAAGLTAPVISMGPTGARST